MSNRHMRRYAFLALCGVLLAVLAPTVSYALAVSQGSAVVEMCTSFGIQKVKLPQDADQGGQSSSGDQACPFCLFAHATAPLPGPQAMPGPTALIAAGVPPRHAAATRDHNLSWFAIRSHAPPTLS
ncbi:MAG: DUF2946 domain-containing protein [Gallionellaceae bacterium]|nr:DUF2946 domain-containing protein [Gallionellaceae bacterium]